MQPLKIRDAHRMIAKAGGTIHQGGKHNKVTHPNLTQTFTLPHRGAKGRPTLSPGMTVEFNKFHAMMLAVRDAS